jgi:hypothetical protein
MQDFAINTTRIAVDGFTGIVLRIDGSVAEATLPTDIFTRVPPI